MIDLLDIFIATAAVILGLSLIVQAVQQIIKQTLDLKSSYMKSELLAMFSTTVTGMGGGTNLKSIAGLAANADDFSKRIVGELETCMKSFGFSDLHLIENISEEKLIELISHLPVASDPALQEKFNGAVHDIEHWFEMSKQAFQDHYERRMRYWSFGIAAIVVMVMNANIFGIYNEFKSNKATRDAMVAATPQIMQIAKQQSGPHSTNAKSDTSSQKDSVRQASHQDTTLTDEERMAIIKSGITTIQTLSTEKSFSLCRWNTPSGDRLRLPGIGADTSAKCEVGIGLGIADFATAFGRNLLGWAAMILLVSLGAPFWYDLLNTLTGIKNSYKPSTGQAGNNPPVGQLPAGTAGGAAPDPAGSGSNNQAFG